ncbi:hypothetical protein JYK02_15555 [Corallococcus macrosporus]|uniref:DUF7919 domain-containing protein n=1 Tax=Corallococcus macrosporus TaxID=35 RepID=A0ABS3DEP1_9BACT|nr:hypothetical protein [Corallococcus macrosporus]MBN8228925.1 hypothetical protein [Corallococcus macrosporus]
MAHFQDLAPCSYMRLWEQSSLAVGWLEKGNAYPRGAVDEKFFRALLRLCAKPWQPPVVSAGVHLCSLCQFAGRLAGSSYGGASGAIGTENVFIPGETKVFVAPAMIVHYIDAHEYVPPREFQEAVLKCPEMRSMPYFKALKDLGFPLSGY